MNTQESELLIKLSRYKKVIDATKKFHSKLDKENILEQLIFTLEEVYPEYTYSFIFLQEHSMVKNLPVVELDHDSQNKAALKAYVSGEIQFEAAFEERNSFLYAPLKGDQYVYGVLQILVPARGEVPRMEIEFISLLTNHAGTALENANLYDQSRQVISELELINETSKRLNSNLRLTETMKFMSKQIKQTFEAQEVGFFLFSKDQSKVRSLPGSTPFFMTDVSRLYIDHIKTKIHQQQEPLFIGDLLLPSINEKLDFRSLMAVPMIHSNHLKGFSIVLHQNPYFFTFETFKLLQSLIYHSSLALTNSMLREELEHMIITDHLTKLHSRNYLDEKIQRSMKEENKGTFILIDIDNFKEINDTFGHQVGDDILIQVANLIKSNIRGNDIGARWGGEELAIYLPRATLDVGLAVAERLVEKVAECSSPKITISCGVSYWSEERLDNYNELFKRADEALYLAKGTGKNRAVPQKNNIIAS